MYFQWLGSIYKLNHVRSPPSRLKYTCHLSRKQAGVPPRVPESGVAAGDPGQWLSRAWAEHQSGGTRVSLRVLPTQEYGGVYKATRRFCGLCFAGVFRIVISEDM